MRRNLHGLSPPFLLLSLWPMTTWNFHSIESHWSVHLMQDEVFHVPQAQKYCSGNFLDWDSKITTFPGLYLLSAAAFSVVSKLLWQLLGIEIRSSVILLRLLNVCISFFSFLLYRACRLKVTDQCWFLATNVFSQSPSLNESVAQCFLTIPRSNLLQGTAHWSLYLYFFIQ